VAREHVLIKKRRCYSFSAVSQLISDPIDCERRPGFPNARRLLRCYAGPLAFGFLILALLTACSVHAPTEPSITNEQPQLVERQIEIHGVTRTYHVFNGGTENASPIVIALHGGGGNGLKFADQAGLIAKAKAEGFILVLPNGAARVAHRGTWNATGCCGYAVKEKMEDVAFVTATLSEVVETYHADPTRAYLIGISNGGMLAFKIAIEKPETFAAIGVVVGAMFDNREVPKLSQPLIMITGTNDALVPEAGGMSPNKLVRSAQTAPFKSAANALKFWAAANDCVGPPKITNINGVIKARYGKCAGGSEVVHISLDKAGHAWPGGRPSGLENANTNQAINATDVLWSFVKTKRLVR